MSTHIIPADLLGTNPGVDTIQIKRIPVRQVSDVVSGYTYGSQVYISLPAGLNDLRDSYISFFAQLTAVGGTYARFPYPIGCIFNRMRIELGSNVLFDCQDFDVLQGMFLLASSGYAATNVTQEGSSVAVTRAAQSVAGRLYTMKLNNYDLLNRVWPLGEHIKMPLRIVLTVNPNAATFLEYDGTQPILTLNNVYLNYYSLQVPQAVYDLMSASVSAGTALIKAHCWDNYNTSLSSATSQSILLPFKYRYLNAILTTYRLQSAAADATQQDKYTNILNASSTEQSAWLKVGSSVYPADRWDLSQGSAANQGVTMFQPVVADIFENETHPDYWQQGMYMALSPTTRVIVPIGLYGDPSTSHENNAIFGNGINTADSAQSANMNVVFWAASGALTSDIFAKYEQIIKILPGGGVDISQ